MITTINEFKKINENNEEIVYIEFYNKDKNFSKDKIVFTGSTAYDDAITWGKNNLEKFNLDMIKFDYI